MDFSRDFLEDVRRVVIEVGSKIVVGSDGVLLDERVGHLCLQVRELYGRDYEIILVILGDIKPSIILRHSNQDLCHFLRDYCDRTFDRHNVSYYFVGKDHISVSEFKLDSLEVMKSVDKRVISVIFQSDEFNVKNVHHNLEGSADIVWEPRCLSGILAKELKAGVLVMSQVNSNVKSRDAISAAYAGVPVIIVGVHETNGVLRVLNGENVGMVLPDHTATFAASARRKMFSARQCSERFQNLSTYERKNIFLKVAKALEEKEDLIMAENKADVAAAKLAGNTEKFVSRLTLLPGQVSGLAKFCHMLVQQEDPLERVLGQRQIAVGLPMHKKLFPLGVLLIIAESRPDALIQTVLLALQCGNGILLHGGTAAIRSNVILHKVISEAIPVDVGQDLVGLISYGHIIRELLKLENDVTRVISMGSESFVSKIREATHIPVRPKIDEGVCHIYIDKSANLQMATAIVLNSKINCPNLDDAVGRLLVHEDVAKSEEFNDLIMTLNLKGVNIQRGPRASIELRLAESTIHQENNAMDCEVEIVNGIFEAIYEICKNRSFNVNGIIAEDEQIQSVFLGAFVSGSLHVNSSTCDYGRDLLRGNPYYDKVGIMRSHGRVSPVELLTSRWIHKENIQVAASHKRAS